jgi:quercetin dioxygenase-like cupin family protein
LGVKATTGTTPTVLDADAVAGIAGEPLDAIEGVTNRVLWRDDRSMAGLLTVRGGHHLGLHAHRENHHHIWVTDGSAEITGTVLGPGAYAHIPAGVDHDIDARATEGCTVFYLYIRQA